MTRALVVLQGRHFTRGGCLDRDRHTPARLSALEQLLSPSPGSRLALPDQMPQHRVEPWALITLRPRFGMQMMVERRRSLGITYSSG